MFLTICFFDHGYGVSIRPVVNMGMPLVIFTLCGDRTLSHIRQHINNGVNHHNRISKTKTNQWRLKSPVRQIVSPSDCLSVR